MKRYKRYKVTVSYRPHVSSLARNTESFSIEARNKQIALIRAGWLMHLNEMHHVSGSIAVEVTPL